MSRAFSAKNTTKCQVSENRYRGRSLVKSLTRTDTPSRVSTRSVHCTSRKRHCLTHPPRKIVTRGVWREDLFDGRALSICGRQPEHPITGPPHVERIIDLMREEERRIRRRQRAELKRKVVPKAFNRRYLERFVRVVPVDLFDP